MKLAYPVRVDTSQYRFSHGREPRGYGLWLFAIGDEQRAYTATYGKAKAFAIRYAKSIVAYSVTVLP